MRQSNGFFRPCLETLEDRLAPTAGILYPSGVLQIRGTNGTDVIRVVEDPAANTTTVSLNGSLTSFETHRINRIDVYGWNGHDTVDLSQVISKPSRLFGGNGNDTLIGGGQRDLIYGQYGHDTMRGGPGYDYFHGGPNVNTAYVGPNDQGAWYARYRYLDSTDAPAATITLSSVRPFEPPLSSHHGTTSGAGEYTALGAMLYAPVGNPVTAYSITVRGNFSGVGSLLVTRSTEANTSDASLPVAISSIISNSDGSKTLVFAAPVTVAAQQAMQFQIRFQSSGNLPVDLNLISMNVAGSNAALQYLFRIGWNV